MPAALLLRRFVEQQRPGCIFEIFAWMPKAAPGKQKAPKCATVQAPRPGNASYGAGTVLESLFIIGKDVLSVRRGDSGGETEVLRFGPGDTFGEIGLLTGASCGARIIALAPSTVYELAKADLAPILEARPQIAQELSRALAQQQDAGRALATAQLDKTEATITLSLRVSSHKEAPLLKGRAERTGGQGKCRGCGQRCAVCVG